MRNRRHLLPVNEPAYSIPESTVDYLPLTVENHELPATATITNGGPPTAEKEDTPIVKTCYGRIQKPNPKFIGNQWTT